jgi:PHD/YefM family antitoxin component YafN of YafNO toxin-antitoxin module
MDAQFLERSKGHDSRSLESEEKYRMLMFEDEIEKKSYTNLLSKLSQAQALLEPDTKWNQHQTEDENRRKD